ncbi:hypothetical protein NS44R_14930 [Mammaliicoccus sciuri]|nr:hypothetical protein NS44R_14930 [Mammaliicoccus sciuri]
MRPTRHKGIALSQQTLRFPEGFSHGPDAVARRLPAFRALQQGTRPRLPHRHAGDRAHRARPGAA